MELGFFGKVRQAFLFWMQAIQVLLKNPMLLVLQVAVVCLSIFLRLFSRQIFSFLSPINAHVIFLILLIGCLYFLCAFLSHYTLQYIQNKRVTYKESFFSVLHSYKQLVVYILLFVPFVYLFLYEPPTPYGQNLFFASLGIGEFAQHINISIARILFTLLAVLLLFIFIMQHIGSVVVWTGNNSPQESAKRAFHLLRHNLVITISLTFWLFLSCFLLLVLLRTAIFIIPNLLQLTMAYYIMTVSLNLYCMALTLFYYEYYLRHKLHARSAQI